MLNETFPFLTSPIELLCRASPPPMSIQPFTSFKHIWRTGIRQASYVCRTCEPRSTFRYASRVRHTTYIIPKLATPSYCRVSFTTVAKDIASTNVDISEPAIPPKPFSLHDEDPVINLDNKTLDDIYKEYRQLAEEGKPITEQDYINLMTFCKRNNSVRAVKFLESLVDDIRSIDPKKASLITRGYNMLLQSYIHDRRWSDAMELISNLLAETKYYNEVTINTMINGSLKTAAKLKNLHQLMTCLETHKYQLTDSNVDRLIKAYHLVGDTESSIINFNRMKAGLGEVGSLAYQSMIFILKMDNRPDDALAIYNEMKKSGVNTTIGTYHILLDMLHHKGRLEEMQEIYKQFQQSGLQPNVSIYLAMGWSLNAATEELRRQGAPLQIRDFNTLIVRSIQENNIEEAISYFQAMQKEGIQANHVSYSIIMDALLKNRTTAQALDMYDHMIKHGVKPDTHAFNTILACHIRDDDRIGCLDALDKMHEKGYTPDARTINFLMNLVLSDGLDAQKDCEFLMKLFLKLKEFHSRPNTKTYNNVLDGLARLSLDRSSSTNATNTFKVIKKQTRSVGSLEVSPANALELMRNLYKEMLRSPIKFSKPNSVTYDVMIGSLIDSIEYKAALRLYEDSKRSRISLGNGILVRIQHCLVESGMDMQVVQMFYDHRNKNMPIKEIRYYNSVMDTCRKLGLEDTYHEVVKEYERVTGMMQD